VLNAWHYGLPIMKAQGSGSFINMASVMGRAHALEEPIYGALKSGVIHLAQTLAIEYGPYGVRLNVIAPGPTPPVDPERLTAGSPFHVFLEDQEMLTALKAKSPLNRVGDPRDCAWTALYLASEVTARHLTGQIIGMDGGWFMPK